MCLGRLFASLQASSPDKVQINSFAIREKKVCMEGLSITKLLVVGVLIVLLFGTSKLRSLGGDLGAALRGFKKAMNDEPTPKADAQPAERVEHKD